MPQKYPTGFYHPTDGFCERRASVLTGVVFFCLLAFQAVLRDALQHSRRALEPGGGSRREVHRAGVHLRPELTAPEPDGCGRPNHAEYEAAEAEGDHL